MGPHSKECGDPRDAVLKLPPPEKLQWGRTQKSAETVQYPEPAQHFSPLQWGRTQKSAETSPPG